jgi:hypothetical protein
MPGIKDLDWAAGQTAPDATIESLTEKPIKMRAPARGGGFNVRQ